MQLLLWFTNSSLCRFKLIYSDLVTAYLRLIHGNLRYICYSVMVTVQEIAWQRLDELQSANGDVISRGVTGLKLYMVAPFLA